MFVQVELSDNLRDRIQELEIEQARLYQHNRRDGTVVVCSGVDGVGGREETGRED